MASEWKTTQVGSVVIINSDSYSKEDNWKSIRYLDTGNITENQVDNLQTFVVGKDKVPSRAKRKVKKGDIVYSLVRPIQKHFGVLKLDTENLLVSTGFATIRAKKGLADTDYVYWFLSQPKIITYLQAIGENSTSAYPAIKPSDIESLEINLPPLSKQKEISFILNKFSEKIELNKKINQTLEQMAQAMFKSWFVDFDPVFDNLLEKHDNNLEKSSAHLTNKGAEDLIPKLQQRHQIKQTSDYKPLPDHIKKEFPNDFQHHEDMGWIPEGWKVGLSGEILDIRDGTHDSPKQANEGYKLITSKHITSGELTLEKAYLISEDDYISINKRSKVNNKDILLTMIGTVGIPYFVNEIKVDFAIKNLALFRTSLRKELSIYFYLLLKSDEMQKNLDSRLAGTTQKYLSLKTLRNIHLLQPNRNIITKFNEMVDSNYKLIGKNREEVKTLVKLRDLVLPQLISGNVRIEGN
ncbi:MAG: restriction endonuclease subunit S [Kangiella sp.]|nr:restriction endonuclease subunit S [Kangiella sp.]